jgi:hypothetical protein
MVLPLGTAWTEMKRIVLVPLTRPVHTSQRQSNSLAADRCQTVLVAGLRISSRDSMACPVVGSMTLTANSDGIGMVSGSSDSRGARGLQTVPLLGSMMTLTVSCEDGMMAAAMGGCDWLQVL